MRKIGDDFGAGGGSPRQLAFRPGVASLRMTGVEERLSVIGREYEDSGWKYLLIGRQPWAV